MKALRISSVVLLAASFVAAPAARAAVDAFIWFENAGIAGDSKDPKHMGWIEVGSSQLLQLRNDVQARSTIGSATGGAGAGKTSFHEFQITKRVDKASPKLFEAATKGTHIPSVTIEMRKAGGNQQEYLVIKLQDVLISSYRAGGARGEGPEESMTLSFGAVKWEYTPQHTPTPGVRVVQAAAVGSLVNIPNAITKVTPSATSATPGQSLTFLVEGTGNCESSRIDFGDGSAVVPFPFAAGKSQSALTHAYSKGGTFEVRAYGLADPWAKRTAPPQAGENVCSGHAFANVAVRLPLAVAAPAVRK